MGLWDRLMGRATEIDVTKVADEFERLLAEDEQVEKAYQLVRDMYVFTNKRLILVDRQSLSGNKMEYRSIPYRSIRQFSIETAGMWDLDAELKLWVAGESSPITKEFSQKLNVYELQKVLAGYIL